MNEPTRPRETAKQIAERIMRGEPPPADQISNVNALREKEAKR
jgi:hypothetical protein